jgi:hypothetical protein
VFNSAITILKLLLMIYDELKKGIPVLLAERPPAGEPLALGGTLREDFK